MDKVYIAFKGFSYEGNYVIGVFSTLNGAREAIEPYIHMENKNHTLCAAYYRWKRVNKSDDIMHLSKRFYSMSKEWREIQRESTALEWISEYSYIVVREFDLDKTVTPF